VNLNRRIETLEKRSSVVEQVYRIIPKCNETPAEARLHYCQENNVTEADLEVGFVVQRIIVSPEDVKDSENS